MKYSTFDTTEFLLVRRCTHIDIAYIDRTELHRFKLPNVFLLRQNRIYQNASDERSVKRISSQLLLQPLHSELSQNLLVYVRSPELIDKLVVIDLNKALETPLDQRRLHAAIYEVKDIRTC